MVVVTALVYQECITRIDYTRLLPLYRPAMPRYIEQGCEPGNALLHVLENDLKAILLFDDPLALQAVVSWVNRELPLPTWGNRQTVQTWLRLARRYSRAGASGSWTSRATPERNVGHSRKRTREQPVPAVEAAGVGDPR